MSLTRLLECVPLFHAIIMAGVVLIPAPDLGGCWVIRTARDFVSISDHIAEPPVVDSVAVAAMDRGIDVLMYSVRSLCIAFQISQPTHGQCVRSEQAASSHGLPINKGTGAGGYHCSRQKGDQSFLPVIPGG